MVDKTEASSSQVERRQHRRFLVELPLEYWQTPEVIKGGLIINLSQTGLLMQSVHKIEIGAQIGIRVYFSKGTRLDCIEGNAKIVWMNLHREEDWDVYRYGVYIMHMPSDYQDRLINYLFMLQEEKSSS
jgi:c-di-GMP-binding flagellar brake protein YcgR